MEESKTASQLESASLLSDAQNTLKFLLGQMEAETGVQTGLLRQAIQAYAEAHSYFNSQVAYFNWSNANIKEGESARKRLEFINKQIKLTTTQEQK